jgi:hypothetical protein
MADPIVDFIADLFTIMNVPGFKSSLVPSPEQFAAAKAGTYGAVQKPAAAAAPGTPGVVQHKRFGAVEAGPMNFIENPYGGVAPAQGETPNQSIRKMIRGTLSPTNPEEQVPQPPTIFGVRG